MRRAQERTAAARAGSWAANFVVDVRRALRGLLRSPGFSMAATMTLVIGIGAVVAAFAIVRGILIEPLSFRQPDRLVAVWQDVKWPAAHRLPVNSQIYFTYRELSRSIESIGLYQGVGSANIADAGTSAQPERVAASWVTATLFSTLQTEPALGRVFNEAEDRQGGPQVVVLSDRVWRERFGGRRDAVGSTIIVNDVPREVIGVMPASFHFPSPAVGLWLPARLRADNPDSRGKADDFSFYAVARLRAGATLESAQHDLASITPRIAELYPDFANGVTMRQWLEQSRPAPALVPLRREMTRDVAKTLWLLAATAAIVLLVGSANVVNLLLIRADGRRVQLAVRHALGASPSRVMSYFFSESLALAAVSGALGTAVAWCAIRGFAHWGSTTIPRATELGIDGATMLFTVFVVICVALVCTLVPALRTAATPLFSVAREGTLNTTMGRAQHRFRSVIAAVQIALALVALNGSVLLLRTLHRLNSEDPGFTADHASTYWMQLPVSGYSSDSSIVAFYARLTSEAAAVPGVMAVGLTSQVPLGRGDARMREIYADAGATHESMQTETADAGYFAALRIPLLAGRVFDPMQRQRDNEVILSRGAARDMWHDATGVTAVGKRIRFTDGGPPYTVIGVVGDVRDQSLATLPLPTVYFPEVRYADARVHRAQRTMALVVRTADGSAPTAAIRHIVRGMNPTLPVFDVMSLSQVRDASLAELSVTTLLLSAAAIIALALGTIGLYGIMDYVVALRTREIGLRVALGANPRSITRMMTGEGLAVALVGIAAGIGLFAMVSRSLRAFLYGVSMNDPMTLAGTAVTLLAIAGIASWVPARRAAAVEPGIVLRSR